MKRRPVPSPGVASCVAGLLLLAAFFMVLDWLGVLEGLWRAGYGGP